MEANAPCPWHHSVAASHYFLFATQHLSSGPLGRDYPVLHVGIPHLSERHSGSAPEINLRPENGASRRVAEKSGYILEGDRPKYLHIDGEWRDHICFVRENPKIT